MARNVKKIKVARQHKHGKKFWIILSSVTLGIAAIACAITIPLVMYLTKEDSYDYFKTIDSEASITYNALQKQVESSEYDHIFVFYWDDTTLLPDDSTTDYELEQAVISLYSRIEATQANIADDKETVAFFLIDTTSSRNSGVLSDNTLSTGNTNTLVYISDDTKACSTYAYGYTEEEIVKYPSIYQEEISGSTKGVINQAIGFVNSLYK